MEKIVIALITILVIVLLLNPTANLVSANFYPVPSLYVFGPSKVLYGPNSASFNFSVETHVSMDTTIVSINHSLDGSPNITSINLKLSYWFPPGANMPNNHKQYACTIALNSLGQGNHTLKVYGVDEKGWVMSRTMDFLVTANSVKVYSPAGPSVNPSDYAHSTPTPTSTPSPTSSISPSPTVPELSWLTIVPLLFSMFSIAVILRHRNTANLVK